MPATAQDLLTDPKQLREAVADQLRVGVAEAAHPWHWPTLVTVLGGRVVVSRAFDREAHTWHFYTDRRAEKVSQLQLRPEAEVVFYDGGLRRQLRLQGRVEEEVDLGLRQNLWAEQSTAAQANYASERAPGTALEAAHQDLPKGWPDAEESRVRAFQNFAVMKLQVEYYDFLQLNREQTLRCRWSAAEASFTWLVP